MFDREVVGVRFGTKGIKNHEVEILKEVQGCGWNSLAVGDISESMMRGFNAVAISGDSAVGYR